MAPNNANTEAKMQEKKTQETKRTDNGIHDSFPQKRHTFTASESEREMKAQKPKRL